VLYAGGLDSTLNAMDTNSGDLIWQLSTGSLLITSPLVDSDGNVYFIKRDTTGSVICSASPSGVIRWISDFNVHQWVSLHMDRDGNIFAYGGDHQLVSCDYAGKLRWHRTMLSGDLGVWPVSIIGDCEGQVYFAYGYKYLLAFDKNGNNKFICELPDYSDGLIMGAISSDGHLYLSSKYQLYCIK
jgi:outer membrane protein assembly factor BamB